MQALLLGLDWELGGDRGPGIACEKTEGGVLQRAVLYRGCVEGVSEVKRSKTTGIVEACEPEAPEAWMPDPRVPKPDAILVHVPSIAPIMTVSTIEAIAAVFPWFCTPISLAPWHRRMGYAEHCIHTPTKHPVASYSYTITSSLRPFVG